MSEKATRIDETDPNNIYIGEAAVGMTDDVAFWQIKKLITVGSVTSTKYADGDPNYDNVWDDRATLTYI